MPDTNGNHHDIIPLDEMEDRELRRDLLTKSRAGDAAAQATLLRLYGVRVSSPTEPTEQDRRD
jgi:hypothetical protein